MTPLREMTARLLFGVFVVVSVVLFVELPTLYHRGLWWWMGGVGAWAAVGCVVTGVVGWLEGEYTIHTDVTADQATTVVTRGTEIVDVTRLDRTPESR